MLLIISENIDYFTDRVIEWLYYYGINNIFRINEDLYLKYVIGSNPFEDENCKRCFSLPICGGGCPHKRIENKFNNSEYDLCIQFNTNLDDYLLLRYNYNIEKP
jgi:uncharacterized protein